MLDVAWPEIVVIGAVALVVIGPKDLPKVMRTLGQWAGKARNMVHDLQRSFDQLNYESEVAEKLRNADLDKAAGVENAGPPDLARPVTPPPDPDNHAQP